MRTIIGLLCFTILLASSSMVTAQVRAPLDIESLKARIADLNPPDKGLPENEYSLSDERRAIDQEIADVRILAQKPADFSKDVDTIEKSKRQLAKAVEEVQKADCKSLPEGFNPAIQVRSAFNTLQRTILFNDLEDVANPWEDDPSLFDKDDRRTVRQRCDDWKKFIGDAARQGALLSYPDQLRQRLLEGQKNQQETQAQAALLLDLLQKRKSAIQKKLTESQTQSNLSSNLWVVIGIIGLLSVSAILAVKLFEKEIQVEWVVSGQVIQFVTVMILLSVIMALGLAGILKENTLGTLLGGIAGYVLAQGVGRAVARDVSRTVTEQQRGGT